MTYSVTVADIMADPGDGLLTALPQIADRNASPEISPLLGEADWGRKQ